MLSGKNKEIFERWYIVDYKKYSKVMIKNHNAIKYLIESFYNKPIEEQKGVYEKYFDSLGYYINIECYLGGGADVYYPEIVWRRNSDHIDTFWKPQFDDGEIAHFNTRLEAFTEAVKQLDKLINDEL